MYLTILLAYEEGGASFGQGQQAFGSMGCMGALGGYANTLATNESWGSVTTSK